MSTLSLNIDARRRAQILGLAPTATEAAPVPAGEPVAGPAAPVAPAPAPVPVAPPQPPQESVKQRRRAEMKNLQALLAINHPGTFCAFDRGPSAALKIGIRHDLALLYPEVHFQVLKIFMHRYTSAAAYQRLLVAGAGRVDLDGVTTEPVTEEAAARAAEQLAAMSVSAIEKLSVIT